MSMTAARTGGNFLGARDYDESIATFYLAGMQLHAAILFFYNAV